MEKTYASEAAHWYTVDGVAKHEVARADGKGMRPTNLKDARKEGLLPSVTTILGLLNKPGLNLWQNEQAIYSAMTLHRNDNETDDEFVERAKVDAKEQVKDAARWGKDFHAEMQMYLQDGKKPVNHGESVAAVVATLEKYAPISEWESEVTVVSDNGYAGMADLVCRSIQMTADVKTKDYDDPEKKPRTMAWPEQVKQMGGYAAALGFDKPRCLSIFPSRKVPGLVLDYEWSAADVAHGIESFIQLVKFWHVEKKYKPGV